MVKRDAGPSNGAGHRSRRERTVQGVSLREDGQRDEVWRSGSSWEGKVREGTRDGLSRRDNVHNEPQGALILRIKRKRGADPIEALRIGLAEAANGGGTSPEEETRPKRRLTDREILRMAESAQLDERMAVDEEIDSLDRRFAGLLGDYLKDQDLEPPKDIVQAADIADHAEPEGDSDSEEDYVYDLYYHDREPVWGVSFGPEHDTIDEDEIELGSRLVSEELLNSDDPYEEGEDEDSNDEGFYRNDYPQQDEEADEDAVGDEEEDDDKDDEDE